MYMHIYESEPYTSKFSARVERIDGDWITLDQTAFFPGGGGQDPDVGDMDGIQVKKVKQEGEDRSSCPRSTFCTRTIC